MICLSYLDLDFVFVFCLLYLCFLLCFVHQERPNTVADSSAGGQRVCRECRPSQAEPKS